MNDRTTKNNIVEIFEDAKKIVEKIETIIREQYKEYNIKIYGINIEKTVDKGEYGVTALFEVSKNTPDGLIVIEQKVIIFRNTITFTKPYKYIK